MKASAFTLIELLVVLVIIGLIIAILLPAIRGAVDSAKTAACMNNLRQIYLGIEMYNQDHDMVWLGDPTIPNSINYLERIWSGSQNRAVGIGNLYSQYLDDLDVFYCPGRGPYSNKKTKIYFGQSGSNATSDYYTVSYSGITKFEDLKSRIIVEDIVYNPEGIPFGGTGPHRKKYNQLRGDGSVGTGTYWSGIQ